MCTAKKRIFSAFLAFALAAATLPAMPQTAQAALLKSTTTGAANDGVDFATISHKMYNNHFYFGDIG
jgi:hypothetical protein